MLFHILANEWKLNRYYWLLPFYLPSQLCKKLRHLHSIHSNKILCLHSVIWPSDRDNFDITGMLDKYLAFYHIFIFFTPHFYFFHLSFSLKYRYSEDKDSKLLKCLNFLICLHDLGSIFKLLRLLLLLPFNTQGYLPNKLICIIGHQYMQLYLSYSIHYFS